MPINWAWIIALIGGVLAVMVWARTKRAGPAVGVFLGGVLIMMFADPSTLTTAADAGRELFQRGLDEGLNN